MSLLITDAGISASIEAEALGVNYKITHIGIGLDGYVPTLEQTQLKNEVAREALSRGSVPALGQLHFEAVFAGNTSFDGKEIGYFLEDGTLFAVDSRDGEIMSLKRSNTIITESFELNLAGSSIKNITVELMGAPYATEELAGIAKITTIDKMNSDDDETIVTPKKLKDNTATDDDIDTESNEPKFIQLPQLWRGIQKFVLDKLWLPLAELIYPVGCPIPYPAAEAPPKFIAYIGQSFDKTVFTKLAERFPSGVMPDMRKHYIRGLGEGETPLSIKGQSVQALGFSHTLSAVYQKTTQIRSTSPSSTSTGNVTYSVPDDNWSSTTPTGRSTPYTRGVGIRNQSANSIMSGNGTITGTGVETNPNSVRWLYITRAA
ncbi:phage tail protein [Aliivibrio fischeri]|uniref:phage tail-collar fiber domain-containing protein n=1 Tax=Aliivibrio fischeri TaxID=668 RepID=UPI0012D87EBC|nr:phage tail protein [Aliivibrio fischeri]MUK76190.1 phage tail protein [Aliivibrio fischeri]